MNIKLSIIQIQVVFILVSIIILLVLSLFKKTHNFWNKQPVMRDNTLKEGVISNKPYFNIKIKSINHSIRYDSTFEDVNKFLVENFSEYYTLNQDYIKHVFNKSQSKNITMTNKNKIIGFIHSTPIKIIYNDKPIKFQFVDYLCIDKDYRNRNIASILISSLLNAFKNNKTPFLFKIEKNPLPFKHIIKSSYFIKDLSSFVPNETKNIKKIDVFSFYKVLSYTNKLLDRYKFHKKYTKKEFFEIFIEKKLLELFIINNSSGNDTIIIGKKTTYRLYKQIYNCFVIDYIIGENRYSSNVINILSNYLKNMGYNYICISGLGSNYNFIKDNGFIKGDSHYYYTYNYAIKDMNTYDFCFNID